jgi:hypothetical protein
MKAIDPVVEQSSDTKLRSQLDDELEALRRPGAADKLRRAFEATPENIAKAATNARRRKR